MRVLLTGHNGYIGSVMARVLADAGHSVTGLDTYLFEACTFGPKPDDVAALRMDLRDVSTARLEGFDAVVHLGALCNDPLGDINPALTFEINHLASVELGRAAKRAGIERFVFGSSCSLYGVSGSGLLDEGAPFAPITPYGVSKVRAEQDLAQLGDDRFSPTFMRNATAYGVSPRLRADVVINNLVGHALTSGLVALQSDGTAWRPVVHVEDFCSAFVAVLGAPRGAVHNEAFNVGSTAENYRVSELAEIVAGVVPGSRVSLGSGGSDPRSYRVDCDKLASVTGFVPRWTARRGAQELLDAYVRNGLTKEEFLGDRYFRITHVQKLQREGRLDESMRWVQTGSPQPHAPMSERGRGGVLRELHEALR